MSGAVFVLCAVASALCAGLLARGYARSQDRLILGALLCFGGLLVTNVLLAIDTLAVPGHDLPWRGIPAALGFFALLATLVAEER